MNTDLFVKKTLEHLYIYIGPDVADDVHDYMETLRLIYYFVFFEDELNEEFIYL